MKSLSPNLAVKNIAQTVKYYIDNFGFELQMAVDETKKNFDTQILTDRNYIWAMIKCGEVEIMLQKDDNLKKDLGEFFDDIGSSSSIYIGVEDVDDFYKKVQNNDVEIYKNIETTWYGQREFYIKDLDGYILGFASAESK